MTTWKHGLNVSDFFHSDLEPNELANKVVDSIISSSAHSALEEEFGSEYFDLLEEMRDVDDVEWFDACWSAFYDMADYLKIWVVTR